MQNDGFQGPPFEEEHKHLAAYSQEQAGGIYRSFGKR